MSTLEKERERFEKWVEKSKVFPSEYLTSKHDSGEYFFHEAHTHWEAWQAARATPALLLGVEAWAASGKDYDRNIHSNPDAKAWADFFMETFPNCGADHETMHSWFANAMMAMHVHLLSGMAIVPVEPTPESIKYEKEWSHKNHGDNSI